jgi:hypothetical protein
MCSSPTERNVSAAQWKRGFRATAHLQLELFPYFVLLVSLDNDVEIIKVFDDEVVPLVHRQKNLLDGGITGASTRERSVQFPRIDSEYTRGDLPSEKDTYVS